MDYRRGLLHRFGLPCTTIVVVGSFLASVLLLTGQVHGLDLNKRPNELSKTPQHVATVWQTEQGLPQNSVAAIMQDHEGYLWLATAGGLARFDGVRFTVFGGEDFPSLQSSRFQSLFASRSGELWIGTRNGGLIRLDNGVVTTFLERDGLPSRNIRSIREDAEGKLWINTISGVACCAGGKLQAYATYRGKAVSEFFLQARDGGMWFRSGMNIVRFGPDGATATLAGGSMVQEARDGSVWIAFQHQYRLVRYYQKVFSDVPLPAAGVRQWRGADSWQGVAMAGDPRQAVLAMATDTDGELLLLMPTGLVRVVDGRLGPLEALLLPANIGDLPQVLSLMVDREGNRWVGTVGRGLFRFRRAPLMAYGKLEGLSDSPFRAVFQDREGRMWLAGDAAVYWFDRNQFHLTPGLAEIGAIAQTNDGDLWFGGSGAVYRWHSGVLRRFRIESPAVFKILQDREGTLWVVAPDREQIWRLYRFAKGEFEKIDADVVNMAEDRDGGLWLASVNPPALRILRGGKTVLYDEGRGMPPNGVHSFCQDLNGVLWFSTTTGLYRLRDSRFGAITKKNDLTSEITSILDDGNGSLWLPTEQGIFHLSLKDLNDIADGRTSSIPPVSYGIAEGMKTSECNGGNPGAFKARDGWLWFPTMRGVVAVDPNAINDPPPVVLEEAWANKLRLVGDRRTSVPAGNDTFDFRFTALNLSAPERQRFKYRLEPFDKGWVDAGTRRSAHYTNMPPGEYTFRVIAANSFGIWNGKGASLSFVLRPHFYQMNWFRAFCVFLTLALVWAVYQWRLRQLRHQFALTLETRIGERTRIARDLHDTLLQSFHAVLLRLQTVSQLLREHSAEAQDELNSTISEVADAITEGRDAVQGLRESTVQENDLVRAISTLGDELANNSSGDQPQFRVTAEGEARNLHPIIRDGIYRIAGEALRNAFRHAHAHKIEVEIRFDDEQFRLRVRDDGRGIDPAVLSSQGFEGHFGLPGMHERAILIGGKLTVWSEVDAGTEVEMRIPAGIAYTTGAKRSRLSQFIARKTKT